MALSVADLQRALALRDLSDPAHGPHAMQLLFDAIHAALPVPVRVHRGSPIGSITDNYDRLNYPPGGAARDARYTRYVCDTAVLRSQMSAMIPPLIDRVTEDDIVLSCPGLVYRRGLRALDRTLTHAECNALRDEIYAALHRGSVLSWAS